MVLASLIVSEKVDTRNLRRICADYLCSESVQMHRAESVRIFLSQESTQWHLCRLVTRMKSVRVCAEELSFSPGMYL